MAHKQEIIIGYFRQGKSQRQLAGELNMSRNTIKKYIDEYHCEIQQDGHRAGEDIPNKGIQVIPTYRCGERKKRVLSEEVCNLIDRHLSRNLVKKKSGKHKQLMRGTDIHQELLRQGHAISYTSVCRYIRTAKRKSAEVFIRQRYEPGQTVEFDWGEVKINIAGKQKVLMLAVFTFSYSNHRWARLYYRQDMCSFLDAHCCYFTEIEGVAQEVVYDNMRVAVRKFTIRNSDKEPTEDLLKLSTYYQFSYRFCNARRGNEKGHVERSVDVIRHKAFAPRDDFDSLKSANEYLSRICSEVNEGTVSGQTQSIAEMFSEELKQMHPSPFPYDASEMRSLRVDKYSCIKVDTNHYSVPEGFVGVFISVKVYPDRLEIYDNHSKPIATHERHHTRHEYYLSLDHFLKTLRTKPGALLGSLTLYQADQFLKDIFYTYYRQRSRDFIELLLYIREQQYSISELQCAIDMCISKCPRHSISLDKLKILLMQKEPPTCNGKTTSSGPMSDQIQQNAIRQLQQTQTLFSSSKI